MPKKNTAKWLLVAVGCLLCGVGCHDAGPVVDEDTDFDSLVVDTETVLPLSTDPAAPCGGQVCEDGYKCGSVVGMDSVDGMMIMGYGCKAVIGSRLPGESCGGAAGGELCGAASSCQGDYDAAICLEYCLQGEQDDTPYCPMPGTTCSNYVGWYLCYPQCGDGYDACPEGFTCGSNSSGGGSFCR